MLILLPVLAGVAVLRVVATADLAAAETDPQVYPGVPSGNALLANVRPGIGLLFEPSEVVTRRCHHRIARETADSSGALPRLKRRSIS